MMKVNKIFFWTLLILIGAFLIRAYDFSFPAFTSDEARIAYRGYTLATSGKDELGRVFPVLFDSSNDYQLPLVSYITAGGELVFGKSEFGARLPFIILGVVLVFLIYQISKFFSQNIFFRLTSAFLIASSPTLIFLSKVPNEPIVLTFLLTLLFYLIVNKKNILLIMLIMAISILTSKSAWFLLLPFTFYTLIFQQSYLDKKSKLLLIVFSIILVSLTLITFLTIPQSKRSLLENNFSIVSSVTISNGINKLRGQGIQSGWPQSIDRLLFNKGLFLTVGLLQWLTNMSPAIYFGQFDNSGLLSYSYLGAWAKILLLPFGLGLFFLLRRNDQRKQSLLLYFLILTFPSVFMYPNLSLELVVLTLPFMAFVISFGLQQMNRKIKILVLILAIIEIALNVYFISPEYKNTTALRPNWIKELTSDIFQKTRISNTAVSDDIVSDIVPYIQWYTLLNPQAGFQPIPYPYKFRQYDLDNIKIIGSQEDFSTCGKGEELQAFISKRDIDKINKIVSGKLDQSSKFIKIYKDSNEEEKVYLTDRVCIK